jgi:hypothetical protein
MDGADGGAFLFLPRRERAPALHGKVKRSTRGVRVGA